MIYMIKLNSLGQAKKIEAARKPHLKNKRRQLFIT